MATIRSLIDDALRALSVLDTRRTADEGDARAGLKIAQRLFDRLANYGAGYPMQTVRISESVELEAHDRAVRLACIAGGITVTLAQEPSDGARLQIVDVGGLFAASPVTVSANGWRIEGATASLTLNQASASRTWMFRADLCDWRRVDALTLEADSPYPPALDAGVIALLAMEMAREPEWSTEPPAAVILGATQAEAQLAALYRRPNAARFEPAVTLMGGPRRYWDRQ